jgi:glutamate carboxypeptidase
MGVTQEMYCALEARAQSMVEELGTYVCAESGSRDKAGVDAAGRLAAGALAGLGFDVETIPQPACGDHLVARRRGGGRGRLLALIHLDTVWPRGTLAENPFRVEGDRAYGPGVLDMKAGWVVLFSALRALRERGWDGLAHTTVFACGDEELGSPTGRAWIEREAPGADWVLVLEGARENGALVVERGMVGALSLEVRGVAAHTANPGRGASAVHALAHKILEMEDLSDRARGTRVTVGLVAGGSARQVVPDRATAHIDVRARTAGDAEELLRRVREVADAEHLPDTSARLQGGVTRPAFERNPGTERLLVLARACGREIGLALEGAAAQGGSDGNFTAALGIPTLDGLGAEGGQVCSRNEFVVVESLPRRAALLAGLIAALPAADVQRG